jgi:hypothetical protein
MAMRSPVICSVVVTSVVTSMITITGGDVYRTATEYCKMHRSVDMIRRRYHSPSSDAHGDVDDLMQASGAPTQHGPSASFAQWTSLTSRSFTCTTKCRCVLINSFTHSDTHVLHVRELECARTKGRSSSGDHARVVCDCVRYTDCTLRALDPLGLPIPTSSLFPKRSIFLIVYLSNCLSFLRLP